MVLIAQFVGVAVFWAVYAIAGLKPAIAATLILLIADIGWRMWRREPQRPLFLGLAGLSVVLGIVDLAATTPFAIAYEGVATNLIFAALFAFGAVRAKPLMQEFAEAARGPFTADDAGRTRFFRALGWLWAAYFLARALLCLVTALTMPLAEALVVRSVSAIVTVVPMIALSIGGRRVFMALRRAGWFADQRVGP